MMRANFLPPGLMVAVVVFFSCLSGCGGSDSGNGKETATQAAAIDAASVTEEMEFIAAAVPGCEIAEAPELVAGVMGWRPLEPFSGPLAGVFAALNAACDQSMVSLTALALGSMEIHGDCGGMLSIDTDYADGVATFTLDFNAFCLPDAVSGAVALTGRLMARQVGAAGGIAATEYRADTVGLLTVETRDETLSVDLDHFVYTLGIPGMAPGTGTVEKPDRIRLNRLTVNFETRKRTITLTDLSAVSHASGDDAAVEVSRGRLWLSGKGYVDMVTRRPVIVNGDGDILSGAMDFAGADGAILTVEAGQEAGTFLFAINNAPMDQCMDCTKVDLGDIPLPLL